MVHLILLIIYISFISLGLPDSLLGAAWPAMQVQMQVPVSWMGPAFLTISAATVFSTLMVDRVTAKIGTGRVTACSVALTAIAVLGFAFTKNYWMLFLWASPYGLGAGSVDACLNNYVALHYSGKHMSWLHCMWGLGATVGPYIMGYALGIGKTWGHGYLYIGIFQCILTVCLFASIPLWNKASQNSAGEDVPCKPLPLRQILRLPKVKSVFLAFFCYCAVEQTLGQWAASYFYGYLHLTKDMSASLAGLYFMGITVGRAINGFLTVGLSDKTLVRAGVIGMILGLACMLLPLGLWGAVVGVVLVGLGSAPVFPCILHATPQLFGAEHSQSLIGVEMACAYVGMCLMPLAYGTFAGWVGIWTLPVVLLAVTIVMGMCHERLYK